MAILFSPVLNEQQFTANGIPLAGGLIYTYLAGTTTPVVTYKTSTGTAHTNPIVLDSSGNYPTGTQLWLDSGKVYKFVVQDSTGVTLRTIDDITAINDVIATPDEWVSYTASAVTYISANSFSIVGDQTGLFQPGRRIKTTNTGGTVYGDIVSSVYSAPNTTVTILPDSGVLDAGLSAVFYGILGMNGQSIPNILDSVFRVVDNSDVTKKLAFECSGITAGQTRTMTAPNYSGMPAVPAAEGTIGSVLIGQGTGVQPVWGFPPLVRQTVYGGPVDSNGFASFGGATGATTVTATGTLKLTAAAGQDLNFFGAIANPSWTGLSTNGTMYLFVDITTAGVLTTGSTTLAPVYQWGGAYSTTNGQHTFNIQEMTMKVGDGAAANQIYRVFVGEVTVAGGVVTAITWYALNGRYDSGFTATLPGVATYVTKNHAIGMHPSKASFIIECTTTNLGYQVGDRIINPGTQWSAGVNVNVSPITTASTVGIQTGSTVAFIAPTRTTGSGNTLTAASWKYKFIAERGW